MESQSRIIFKDESYAIVGACFEVYNEMGSGFAEAVYQECLELELKGRGVPYSPQQELSLVYKNHHLKKRYQPDFICFGKIIVEIKALKAIAGEHQSQVHNYLKATDFKLGLLINFGASSGLERQRIVR